MLEPEPASFARSIPVRGARAARSQAREMLCTTAVASSEQRDRVGAYEVRAPLGVGGMGRVYAANDANGDPCALKLLHADLASNAELAARLHEEARLARAVGHRNVVSVIGSGTSDDGTDFLVMRRAAGMPLGTIIQARGPLPMARVRRIATQILDGLAAIHRAGLVHGDLKSDNVLVDDHDQVTIIDLGLARHQGTTPAWLGQDVLSGTPEYMAPEVITGAPMTPAAEVYAAGIIVYEMLTGSTPFVGGSPEEIFERHLRDAVVPPSLRYPGRALPAALEGLVMRALAKDPAARHVNADLFGTALARAIPNGWEDGSLPAVTRAVSTTAPTAAWKPTHPTRERPPARRRLASGTRPHETDAIRRRRADLAACLVAGGGDAAIAAYLALAQGLIAEHRLGVAARELASACVALAKTAAAVPRLWCLLVPLAAVYDRLGYAGRARQTAASALAAARRARDPAGITAAADLVDRLAAA